MQPSLGQGLSLHWTDCVHITLSNNLKLQQARKSIIQADAESFSAWASYFPQFSASAGYDFSKSGSSPASSGTSLGLSGRQLVFDGLSSVAGIRRSAMEREAVLINYRMVSSSVLQELRNAWADHLKAKQNVLLTEMILKIREDQYRTVKFKYEAGRENQGAVKSSEAEMLNSRQEFNVANRNVETTKEALSLVVGVESDSFLIDEEDVSTLLSSEEIPSFVEMATQSLSYRYQKLQTRMAEQSLKSSYGQLLPQVSLSGGVGLSGSEGSSSQGRLSFGVNVGIPLLEGGKAISRIKSTKASLEIARLKEAELQRKLQYDIKSAWYNYRDTLANYEIRKVVLDAAQERSRIADVQYSTGLITFDTWTAIHDSLVNNQKSLLEIKFQIMKAEAAWNAAKGETLEDE